MQIYEEKYKDFILSIVFELEHLPDEEGENCLYVTLELKTYVNKKTLSAHPKIVSKFKGEQFRKPNKLVEEVREKQKKNLNSKVEYLLSKGKQQIDLMSEVVDFLVKFEKSK